MNITKSKMMTNEAEATRAAGISVTVSFHDGYNSDNAQTIASKEVTYGEKYGTLPQPTRSGYIFAGWWPERNLESTEYTSESIVNTINDHTLYAHWAKKYFLYNTGVEEFIRVPGNLSALSNGVPVTAAIGTTDNYQWLISDITGKRLIRSLVDPAYGLSSLCTEDCCNCAVYETLGNEGSAAVNFSEDDQGTRIQLNDSGVYLSVNNAGNVFWSNPNSLVHQHWQLVPIAM